MVHIKLKSAMLATLIIVFSSCKKMLDVDSSSAVSEVNMWQHMEDAKAALMGVYGLTRAALADNDAFWLYGEVRPGEFISPGRQDLKAIANNELTASYATLENLTNWRRWYAAINAANLFLERIHEVKSKDEHYTENNMNVDIAQVRSLRAFAYFYMARIWGDIPLILASNENEFVNKPREDQNKVLAWAQTELEESAEQLPFEYSTQDEKQQGDYYNETSDKWAGALIRKLSDYAILAHISAYQGNYQEVANYTAYIINNYSSSKMNFSSSSYLGSSTGLFNNRNSNQLLGFSFDWNYQEGSPVGHIEELTLASPLVDKEVPDLYLPKNKIIDIFTEDKDGRFYLDTLGNPGNENYFTNFTSKYPIFSKINCNLGGETADENFSTFTSAIIFTRLEDIVLLRAEALFALGDRSDAESTLNTIRIKRGLNNYSKDINGDLLTSIFTERQRELMGEGHRWYDLIRFNKLRKVNDNISNLIENGGIYWPISKNVLGQNSLLEQNNYWK
ncbi:Starch-binding associating with outer membrane [bacterium A37T11]|nr:Starch-binding associating with outer membrane [bacterium A37T11]